MNVWLSARTAPKYFGRTNSDIFSEKSVPTLGVLGDATIMTVSL